MQKFQHKTKIALMILLVGGMFFPLSCEYEQETNWPMFMHDLQNTGCSPSAAPDTSHVLWEFDTGQRLFGSPVVHNGVVYQAGRGSLFALDSETGNLLWMVPAPVVGSTPAIHGKTLYVGTCNGIAALSSDTGELQWQRMLADFRCNPDDHDHPQDFIASSPIVTDTGVIMCTHRNILSSFAQPDEPSPEGINRVVCLDSETDALMWEHFLGVRSGYSPAFSDGIIYINSDCLKALSVEKGEELWFYPTELLFDTSPVVSHETIVTVSLDGTVYAIDGETHELLWKRRLNKEVFSTPAVLDDLIIVVVSEGAVFALDETTGDVVWETGIQQDPSPESPFDTLMNAQASFDSSPAIADGKVFVGLRSGLFLCLELNKGELLWQHQTEGAIIASPAIADEKVFVASTDGKVYCFGIDPETSFEKAREYEQQGNIKRAREFYLRAKDYYQSQGNLEMVKKCEDKLRKETYLWVTIPLIICIIISILLIYRKVHRKST